MATAASSSSKEFPFAQQKTLKFEDLISQIPFFYSTSSTFIDNHNSSSSSSSSSKTFRTTTTTTPVPIDTSIYANDPELYMGDDCDTLYQETLMKSNLLQILTNDMDGFTKNIKDLDINIFSSPEKRRAHQRLGMLLAHVNNDNDKGKSVDRS